MPSTVSQCQTLACDASRQGSRASHMSNCQSPSWFLLSLNKHCHIKGLVFLVLQSALALLMAAADCKSVFAWIPTSMSACPDGNLYLHASDSSTEGILRSSTGSSNLLTDRQHCSFCFSYPVPNLLTKLGGFPPEALSKPRI